MGVDHLQELSPKEGARPKAATVAELGGETAFLRDGWSHAEGNLYIVGRRAKQYLFRSVLVAGERTEWTFFASYGGRGGYCFAKS